MIGKRNKKTIGKRKKRSFNDRFQKRLTTLGINSFDKLIIGVLIKKSDNN